MRDISARELKGHNILAVERFQDNRPVSYTHLDVYKRQILQIIACHRGVFLSLLPGWHAPKES